MSENREWSCYEAEYRFNETLFQEHVIILKKIILWETILKL